MKVPSAAFSSSAFWGSTGVTPEAFGVAFAFALALPLAHGAVDAAPGAAKDNPYDMVFRFQPRMMNE